MTNDTELPGTPTADSAHTGRATAQRDQGYTLIELIIVILILGVLASVVIFAVSGMRAEAAESGCDADRRVVGTAVEAYFAANGSSAIPATGVDHDRYERTLIDAGVLRDASEFHDIDANGDTIVEAGSPC